MEPNTDKKICEFCGLEITELHKHFGCKLGKEIEKMIELDAINIIFE